MTLRRLQKLATTILRQSGLSDGSRRSSGSGSSATYFYGLDVQPICTRSQGWSEVEASLRPAWHDRKTSPSAQWVSSLSCA